MSNTSRILVAEDDPEVSAYLEVALRWLGYSIDIAQDGEEAVACLKERGADYCLLLLDLIMPRKDGLETLREIRQFDPNLPIVMLSGATSPLNVVDAIKSGANDFLAKPISHEDLGKAIQKIVRTRIERVPAPAPQIPTPTVEAFPVASLWTKKLDLFLNQVGFSEAPVLLQGETGVGKEMLARRLHACSPRSAKPFLKLNCAALPSELIESELFGYERGAFTGAFRTNPGKFELADTGTILLDEIGDMDFRLQAKLLQVLQDGEFHRLGGKEICRVDVRIIAATHCDLELAMSENRFREDLYYRLNVIRIEVPPLRDRKEELVPLAQFFLKKYGAAGDVPMEITPSLRQAMVAHDWPGNIRELENLMRKYVILRRPEMIVEELVRMGARRKILMAARSGRVDHFMDRERNEDGIRLAPVDRISYGESGVASSIGECLDSAPKPSVFGRVDRARKEAELEAILAALNASQWNRKQAAVLLNVDYKALLYKMKKLGIGEKAARSATV
jgi:two-component system response regulator AtoC